MFHRPLRDAMISGGGFQPPRGWLISMGGFATEYRAEVRND